MPKIIVFFAVSIVLMTAVSCTRHEVEIKPVEVKPIHITVDVNVRVDRALDDFFGDIDKEAFGEDDKKDAAKKEAKK